MQFNQILEPFTCGSLPAQPEIACLEHDCLWSFWAAPVDGQRVRRELFSVNLAESLL